ncbi:hypothetical protein AB9X29_003759 [Vibrio vulnificus]
MTITFVDMLYKAFHDELRMDISNMLKKQGVVLASHPVSVKVIVAYMSVVASDMSLEQFVTHIRHVKNTMLQVYGMVDADDTALSSALSSIKDQLVAVEDVIQRVVNNEN